MEYKWGAIPPPTFSKVGGGGGGGGRGRGGGGTFMAQVKGNKIINYTYKIQRYRT